MVRALVIAAALAGVIVACSFQGQHVGLGGGHDAAIEDGSVPPPNDALVDGRPGQDAAIDGRPPDAMVDAQTSSACVSATCSAAGGSCMSGTCVIVGSGNPIVCPANMPCEVDCSSGGACQNGLECGAASSCYIRCDGMNACGGSGYTCGAAGCTIDCTVNHACDNQAVMTGGSCTRHCCSSQACSPPSIAGCNSVGNGCLP